MGLGVCWRTRSPQRSRRVSPGGRAPGPRSRRSQPRGAAFWPAGRVLRRTSQAHVLASQARGGEQTDPPEARHSRHREAGRGHVSAKTACRPLDLSSRTKAQEYSRRSEHKTVKLYFSGSKNVFCVPNSNHKIKSPLLSVARKVRSGVHLHREAGVSSPRPSPHQALPRTQSQNLGLPGRALGGCGLWGGAPASPVHPAPGPGWDTAWEISQQCGFRAAGAPRAALQPGDPPPGSCSRPGRGRVRAWVLRRGPEEAAPSRGTAGQEAATCDEQGDLSSALTFAVPPHTQRKREPRAGDS